jgi:hypothetical protein
MLSDARAAVGAKKAEPKIVPRSFLGATGLV